MNIIIKSIKNLKLIFSAKNNHLNNHLNKKLIQAGLNINRFKMN